MNMIEYNLAFIGAGNIAQAIIGGLVNTGFEPACIVAADPSSEQLASLPEDVRRAPSNREAAAGADAIVLCVKPNLMAGVCTDIGDRITDQLVVSVAAGVTTGAIARYLGESRAIVRCMPNTPALVREGMTGLFANEHVTPDQRRIAEQVMGAVGRVHWFEDEGLLDAVTAVSGSGPAYFFLVMEAMQAAARKLGLDDEVARDLVLQTALGAARIAIEGDDDVATLRTRVTSPGGTTEAAIDSLLAAGLLDDFERAINAARDRSVALSQNNDS